MTYALELELPGVPPTQNGSHRHFRAAAAIRKQWREQVCLIAKFRRPPEPLALARVWVTRCSSVRSDYGNRVGAAKPILDGLVDAGILLDDSDDVLPEGFQHYPYEVAPKGKAKTKIRVESAA